MIQARRNDAKSMLLTTLRRYAAAVMVLVAAVSVRPTRLNAGVRRKRIYYIVIIIPGVTRLRNAWLSLIPICVPKTKMYCVGYRAHCCNDLRSVVVRTRWRSQASRSVLIERILHSHTNSTIFRTDVDFKNRVLLGTMRTLMRSLFWRSTSE